ncbi:MAG TPA: oligoribonuclease [Thermoanaerobaculia bacterium]|nr:oligoribonuclease [Thermoanaerobaculia bacterium]
MPKRSKTHLVWIDCEMTGLDPRRNVLLEIASIITDYDLNIVARGPVLAIRQSEAKLGLMDAWNRRTHGKSGLIARVRSEGVPVAEAERRTLAFVKRYCYAGTAPLCGNSICQDRQFLFKYMPKLEAFLNYRNVDVSSIKVLVKEWYGGKVESPKKKDLHQALADIEESIAELDYYRRHVFVPK